MYFDVKLQTKDKTIRGVCFSPEKHKLFKRKHEATSPVKITNYVTKRNRWSQEDEIHINKRSKVDDPSDNETDFDIAQVQDKEDATALSVVTDILSDNTTSKVNVSGRITLNGEPESVHTKGKTLTKQEATLTDETASIRIVLWESDIDTFQSRATYRLNKVMVRSFNGQKYLTINKQTEVTKSDKTIDRDDEKLLDSHINKVLCPAEGVESIQKFLSCSKCQASVPPSSENKFVQCSTCNLAQLKTKCKTRTFAKVLFQKNISLSVFDDKLQQLHTLYQQQEDNLSKPFHELSDNDIIEILLTVNATILYNNNKSIVSVKSKDE